MKKLLSILLVFLISLGCVGCSNSSAETGSSAKLPKNIQMYVPGTSIETDFGGMTILDAAFTAKAQIYYYKTSRTTKTTVNGETTEKRTENIYPGYFSASKGRILFALRTVMANNTSEDIEIHEMPIKVTFGGNESVYFSKGGNYDTNEAGYRTLPAGKSAEFILATWVPVEQYLSVTECLVEVGGTELGFAYDNINIYNALGYQDDNNTTVTIDEVIAAAYTPQNEETEAATEPKETEPPIQTFPGINQKDGTAVAEGRAVTIENVSVGFRDQLPSHILDEGSSSYKEKMTLNETQVYSVISFTATNLTTEEIDLADIHDDFLVQLTYGNGYQYSTNTDTYVVFEADGNIKRVSKSSTSGHAITVSPLASADVTVYIPCARKVADDVESPLSVTFIAKYTGNESFKFTFDRG